MEPETIALDDLSAFRSPQDHWQVAGAVRAPRSERRALHAEPGTGVLVGLPTEETQGDSANLFTAWEHGDLFLEMDVMMPKGSNSGVYLMSRYEVQLLDSWGVAEPSAGDMGGLYERWDPERPEGTRGYQGHPPRLNVARAPGLWQHLEVEFEAPEFDAQGEKTRNARFAEVRLNGVVIHKNVTLTGPTRGHRTDEVARAPLMIQGDHGPVALRNIRYRRYGDGRVELSGMEYRYFDAESFGGLPNLDTLEVTRAGATDVLTQRVASDNNAFALEVTGTMQVPAAGAYRFDLSSGGGLGRLVIGGQAADGLVELEAGAHPFTLLYVKDSRWSRPSLALYATGPNLPRHELTAPRSALSEEENVDPIFVEAGERPYVLRSFVWHGEPGRGQKRTHAASVGHASRTHYTVDLARGALLRVWKGGFVDATPMWDQRGNAQVAVPRGSALSLAGGPPVATLSSPEAPWPDSLPDFHYQGYRLDDEGHPAFRYRGAGLSVEDRLRPAEDGRLLRRELTLRPGTAGSDTTGSDTAGSSGNASSDPPRPFVRLAAADQIERLPDGSYAVGDFTYYIDAVRGGDGEPRLRQSASGQAELVLPVRLGSDGTPAQVSYQIVW